MNTNTFKKCCKLKTFIIWGKSPCGASLKSELWPRK